MQIDEIPILSTFGLNSSAHDVFLRPDLGIQSLEFVRGGSSTLFGAGSVAGIVNYNSVRGSSNRVNKIQLEGATGGRAKMDFLTKSASLRSIVDFKPTFIMESTNATMVVIAKTNLSTYAVLCIFQSSFDVTLQYVMVNQRCKCVHK